MANKQKNTNRPTKRSNKRERSLRERIVAAERQLDNIPFHLNDERVAARQKLAKLERMYKQHTSSHRRHSNRGRNSTRPNSALQMRRIEGGCFGRGKQQLHTPYWDSLHEARQVQQDSKLKLVDGQWRSLYQGTRNIHQNDVNLELMAH